MPSVDDTALLDVFQKYCHFGNRQMSVPTDSPDNKRNSITSPLLDGSKFAKLAREAGLIDGQIISSTEIDIIFNRVKERMERRISFLQFRTALRLIAEKKLTEALKNDPKANVETIEQSIIEAVRELDGPRFAAGTTLPEKNDIVDRLMEGPATYISKSPKDDNRAWKDNLRRNTSSPGSRRQSTNSPSGSRKV